MPPPSAMLPVGSSSSSVVVEEGEEAERDTGERCLRAAGLAEGGGLCGSVKGGAGFVMSEKVCKAHLWLIGQVRLS